MPAPSNLPQVYPSDNVCWEVQILQLFIVYIPEQSSQSTPHFPISLTHSTLLWNILSLRDIQSFRHDAADVRVTLGYDVAKVVGVFLRFGINIRFHSQG